MKKLAVGERHMPAVLTVGFIGPMAVWGEGIKRAKIDFNV